jgi:hypothetical protein
LVPAGHPCELNRDEQCAAPPNWEDLASTQNFNGSLCLRSVCMFVYHLASVMGNLANSPFQVCECNPGRAVPHR